MKIKRFLLAAVALLAFGACSETPEAPFTPGGNGGGNGGATEEGVYINETFAKSFGVFSTQETVGEYPWIIDYSTAKATSYVDTDGDGKGDTNKEDIVVSTITMYEDLMFIPYAGKKRYFAVYNTASKKIFSPGKDGKTGFIDDLTQGPLVTAPYEFCPVTSLQKNQLVDYIKMSDLDVDDYSDGKFKQFLKKHKVDEFSNPVVRLVNLK